jgi:phage gpG-like protein
MRNVVRVAVGGVDIEMRTSGTDPAFAAQELRTVSTRTADLKPVWLGFQMIWFQQEQRVFTAEGIPPWPRLSPAYQERKYREVGPMPILVYSGRLRESLTGNTADTVYTPTARTLRMGTKVPYSTFLQDRRPHVVLLPETFTELARLVADYLTVPLQGQSE